MAEHARRGREGERGGSSDEDDEDGTRKSELRWVQERGVSRVVVRSQ